MSGDYTQAGCLFKVKKVVRYMRLYGLSRTFVKVKSQYHMKSTEEFEGQRWKNSACRTPGAHDRNVAIIGCGNFAFSNIAYYLKRCNPRFLRATYNIGKSRALSLCKAYEGAYAVANWREVLSDPQVKIVFIASNHASHAEYAAACIEAGKYVYIEKPIAVSREQLVSLLREFHRSDARVFAGYNRPFSAAIRALHREIVIEPAGGFSIQCFVSGHKLAADHWYRRPEEGTRICGNVGHWLDLALHIFSWREMPDVLHISLTSADESEPDDNLAITIRSDRRDIFSVMLTSSCEPFEGINESINIQHANTICKIDDFRQMTIWQDERLIHKRFWPKNVGHRLAVLQPYQDKINRDWHEVVLSTLLMLHITDMVRHKVRTSSFSLRESYESLIKEIESTHVPPFR